MLIEQAMFFALGFLVAGLGILMLSPAIWRRAMRLSMRRLQMLAPLSREQAIAERDLLRAEFAVRERRLEQAMDAVKASKAQDLLSLGRHAAQIADLGTQLAKSEARGRELEIQLAAARKSLSERTALLGSTEAALHEMTERAERGVASLRSLRSEHEELGRENTLALTQITAHEAKIADLDQWKADLSRDLAQSREDFAKLKAEAERLGLVDAKLSRVAADLESTMADKLSLEQAIESLRARAKEDGELRAGEIAHLETALREARAEARERADQLEITRADNSMLQAAVEALRKDHARMRDVASQGAGGETSSSARDLAALRREIADFGARVLEAPPAASSEREPPRVERAR